MCSLYGEVVRIISFHSMHVSSKSCSYSNAETVSVDMASVYFPQYASVQLLYYTERCYLIASSMGFSTWGM